MALPSTAGGILCDGAVGESDCGGFAWPSLLGSGGAGMPSSGGTAT